MSSVEDAAIGSGDVQEVRHVVILGDYEGAITDYLIARLPTPQYVVTGYRDSETSESVVKERLSRAHVAVVIRERTPLSAAVITAARHLELIVSTGTHTRVVALDAGVPVAYTRSEISAAAEHTWALLMSWARDIPTQTERLRSGQWQNQLGVGLAGKTLGILGLGRVGSRVARMALAFEMRVSAWSPHMTSERARAHGATYRPLDALIEEVDFLSVHLRVDARTRGLISDSLLDKARPELVIINSARSALVDTPAVVQALHEGRIAGLAQDVFDAEPISVSDPLLHAPRVLLTPHLGYATADNFRVFASDTAENITQFYTGALERRLAG